MFFFLSTIAETYAQKLRGKIFSLRSSRFSAFALNSSFFFQKKFPFSKAKQHPRANIGV